MQYTDINELVIWETSHVQFFYRSEIFTKGSADIFTRKKNHSSPRNSIEVAAM